MKAHLSLIAAALAVFAASRAGAAESPTETRLREALRSATTQLRALEDERAHWQATDAEQKKQIESLKQELAAASSKPREKKAAAKLTQRLEEQTEENAKIAKRLAECETAGRSAAETAAGKDEELTRAKATIASLNQAMAACAEKNARLYQLSQDFVAHYSNPGFGYSLASVVEPVFGLHRAELENYAQDMQDKLSEQQVKP